MMIIEEKLTTRVCFSKKNYGSGGIRTHASEETGALNQRLRPLGHATSQTLLHPKIWQDGLSPPPVTFQSKTTSQVKLSQVWQEVPLASVCLATGLAWLNQLKKGNLS